MFKLRLVDEADKIFEEARNHRIDKFVLESKIAKFKRENIPPQHWRD